MTVRKSSPDFLMAVHNFSPDGSLDQKYMANYVGLHVRDELLRVPGVGDIGSRAARDYAMRIWIDPDRAAARSLTVDDIVSALRAHNTQVAAGAIGAPPNASTRSAYQLNIQALGRLSTPEQFGQIIIKTDTQGRVTRVNDVARVELGAQDYTTNAYMNEKNAVALGILSSRAPTPWRRSRRSRRRWCGSSRASRWGWTTAIIYNPTEFVSASIDEVYKTLFIALVLVVLVVLLFLQSWRAALIPIIAIPVSLIGAFAVMAAFKFSLNNLSLFGLVLAIGIVVDDAIVVVENVDRHLREGNDPARGGPPDHGRGRRGPGRHRPRADGGVHPDRLHQRHLGPVLQAVRPDHRRLDPDLADRLADPVARAGRPDHEAAPGRCTSSAGRARASPRAWRDRFNQGFDKLSHGYSRLAGKALGVIARDADRLRDPGGAGLHRPDADAQGLHPGAGPGQPAGLRHPAAGLVARAHRHGGAGRGPPPAEGARDQGDLDLCRGGRGHRHHRVQRRPALPDPEVVQGSGEAAHEHQADHGRSEEADRPDRRRGREDHPAAARARHRHDRRLQDDRRGPGRLTVRRPWRRRPRRWPPPPASNPAIGNAYVGFNTKTPRLFADIDRQKAEILGVPDANVFGTLQTYLGSTFVNDFNLFGHTFQVLAQADSAVPRRPLADHAS